MRFVDSNVLVYAVWSPEPGSLDTGPAGVLRSGDTPDAFECKKVLSEDFNPDQDYDGVRAVNPFGPASSEF
jgi:hypothetical protein